MPAFLLVNADALEHGHLRHRFGYTLVGGLNHHASAFFGKIGGAVTDQQSLAECGHCNQIAGLRSSGKQVDGFIIFASRVAGGNLP